MSNISRKLEQIVDSAQRKLISHNQILPVKTAEGILVGDVLIVSEGTIKHLWQQNELIYEHVYLNAAAIKMANLLARKISRVKSDAIYRADQEYGKWFTDSQLLRTRFQRDKDFADYVANHQYEEYEYILRKDGNWYVKCHDAPYVLLATALTKCNEEEMV